MPRHALTLLVSILSLGSCAEHPNVEDAPATSDASATDVSATDASVASDAREVDPRFVPLREAVLADLDTNLATCASVAVWSNDEIQWVGGLGDCGADGASQPDEETAFMIGSDTKKISAILFLQEVAAARASLDTTLGEVLPDIRFPGAPALLGVTAHQLMSHQGGIVDTVGPRTTTATDGELRTIAYGSFAGSTYSMAPPGLFYNYSNPNFALLGLMTETLAGEPWPDLARRRVFEPLEMARTFARKADLDDNFAAGVDSTGPVARADTWESAFMRPAGFVWSTPSDQMRLARFLVDGDDRVLPSSLSSEIHGAHAATLADLPGAYGYGLDVDVGYGDEDGYHDVPIWSHGGNTSTHTSTFFILPDQRFAISILSNGEHDSFLESVRVAVASMVALPPATDRPARPAVDLAALDELMGTYDDPHNIGEITVRREGATLVLQLPDLDAAGVPYDPVATAVTTRVWTAVIQGSEIALRLHEGPDGERYIVHRAFVAVRPRMMVAGRRAIDSRPIDSRPTRETILATVRELVTEPGTHPLLPRR